jgi:hypothetical protein
VEKSRGGMSTLDAKDVSIPFVALLLFSLDMTGGACLNIRRFRLCAMNAISITPDS